MGRLCVEPPGMKVCCLQRQDEPIALERRRMIEKIVLVFRRRY